MTNSILEKEIEELKEQNHRLKLNLESTRQAHATEVEYLKEELVGRDGDYKALEDKLRNEFKIKEKQFQERIQGVQDDFAACRDENSILKGKVEQLQRTLESFKNCQFDRTTRSEEIETLRITAEQKNHELKSARTLVDTQQAKLITLTQKCETLEEHLNELKDEAESKDQCISQLQTRARELESEKEEAVVELQQFLMIQNRAQEEVDDPTKRGNSLFSEVEQRRIRVEEELVKVRERNARLTAENMELQSIIERGDCRSAIIVQQLQTIQKSEAQLVQELRKLMSENLQTMDRYKDKLLSLRKEYKTKLAMYRDGADPNTPQFGELETVRAERDSLLSQRMTLDRELWELKKELKCIKQQRTESDATSKILRVKLQALQEQLSKCDKTRIEVDGNGNASFDKTLNSSGMNDSFGNGGGGDENNKWLYTTMLNETLTTMSKHPESPNHVKVNQNRKNLSVPKSQANTNLQTQTSSSVLPVTSATNTNMKPIEEEIPDCKQQ